MSVGFSEEEADYVRKLHTGHTNQLRLLHYPQEVGQHGDHSRLGAHTDGMLTLKVWIQSVELVLTMVPQLFYVHLPRRSSRSRVPRPRDW